MSVAALAAPVSAEPWNAEAPFQEFTARTGLSQSSASAITQDAAGFLWIATRRGLNRFNGVEFRHYTIADGLPANMITAVYAANEGRMLVGDGRGNVSMIERDLVSVLVEAADLQGAAINELVEYRGRIWIATDAQGLYSFDLSEPTTSLRFEAAEDAGILDLVVSGGYLWYQVGGDLFRYDPRSGAPVLIRDDALAISAAPNGSLWAAISGNKVGIVNDEAFDAAYDLRLSDAIWKLVVSADNNLWVATPHQLINVKQESNSETDDPITIAEYDVLTTHDLFLDREETLWIGTENFLFRYLGDRFRHFQIPEGYGERTTWGIVQSDSGDTYFGTNERLLMRSAAGEIRDLTIELGLPSVPVRDLVLQEQRLWAATRGEGVYLVDLRRMIARRVPGTEEMEVLDVEVDQFGYLWIGTMRRGVHALDTRSFELRRFATPEDSSVYALTVDAVGNVWYGIDSIGLAKLERLGEDSFDPRFYGAEFGLAIDGFDQIATTSPTEAWIGAENGRLLHFRDGDIEDYSSRTPLRDQTIYTVSVLDEGALLLGGEQGLFYFDPETQESHRYGPLQGFLGLEVNVHATHIDDDGYLWLGTIDGPTRMDISMPPPQQAAFKPQILSAQGSQSGRPINAKDLIMWDERGIQFQFEAVSLALPGAIEFSYQLSGHDAEWSNPGRNRTVSYSSLSPGEYRFQVKARYPGGIWQTNQAGFEFALQAPFWRRPVFQVFALLLAIAGIFMTIRWRTHQVARQNDRLKREVEERTRSIEEGRVELMRRNSQLQQEVEQRRIADAARAELEERFQAAFQSTPIGMALLDADGQLLNSNRALREMFAIDDDASLAAEFTSEGTAQILGEDQAVFEGHLQALASGEETSVEFGLTCRRYDGELLHVVTSMTAVCDDTGDFLYCVAQVQDVTESRQMTDKLEYQANYDELSGLLNRRSFETSLDRAYEQASQNENFSFLMFMDLDQFKIVNDTSGHSAGDELLRQISALIRERVRGDDIVGRLGGDEFGLILWQCPLNVAHRVSESIREAIEDFQFNWDAETYRIGISIGVVPIDPSLGKPAEIQQIADAACYQAKENGRNRVHFAQSETDEIEDARGEARWIQRLQYAMDNNRFALFGQVIKPVRADANEPERMEILLRMREPSTRKLVPPGAFLPAAERYGLSVKLDEWVVRSLLRMLYVHDAFGASDRRYWVNLSGTSVGDKRFVDFLIDAVQRCGLPEGMVNFEITETAVIRNVSEAGRLMEALHDMGCQFALDDFGSGLSSFGYLKKLPVDYLKIDGMFIRDITHDETDRIFVKSIIDIARSMEIKTIAEFVENDEILEVITELGADYAQGFGVHRPELIVPEFPSTSFSLARRDNPDAQLTPGLQEGSV